MRAIRNELENAYMTWTRASSKRVTSVCKPCWELRYCPYGLLVEKFPIPDEYDYKRCRVYGHECPVFQVAEPISETIKRRRVIRSISQATKIKVIRRDKNVCQLCGKNVSDEDVNFDHIIPWSKGGSSDENNIRLLCADCNKKRGASYEDKHLIVNISETINEPMQLSIPMLHDLLRISLLYLHLERVFGNVTIELFCGVLNGEERRIDEFAYELVADIISLLRAPRFKQSKKSIQMLCYRWGLKDNAIHSIIETSIKYEIENDDYINQEVLLVRQLGFVIDDRSRREKSYLEYSIDSLSSQEAFDELIADYLERQLEKEKTMRS